MVSEEALVLVDYGLAVRLQRSDGEAAADGGDDSAMGMATVATGHQADLRVGVVPYMSPEQYRRRPYGQPVDVYAFGVVLNELFNGGGPKPWHGMQMVAIGFKVCGGEGAAHRPQPVASGEAGELVRRCWRLAAADRPSMHDVYQALEAMAPRDATPEQLLLGDPTGSDGDGGSAAGWERLQ